MWNPFRREPRPITAAAQVANTDRLLDRSAVMSREIMQAWDIWRSVGEIHYATMQQSRLVARVQWDIKVNGEQIKPEERDQLLQAAFGKNLNELTRQSAVHTQVAGGYNLVRTRGQWHVLPNPPDHKAKVLIQDADVVITNTVPDPRDPDRTDSPVLAAMDPARELLLVRAQARAAARNRTAQLNTVIYPLEGAGPDPKKFEQDLTRVMTAPLENEMSASVVVPNVIGFQGDWIEKWKVMDLTGPIDKNLHEKIPELVKQIAVILDAPPQILLGMSDLNHWAAWAVQEDNWFGHVEPLARTVGDGLAAALAEAAGLDPETIEIIPDPAPLMKRRPSIENVLAAHKARVVNDEFVRKHIGADPDDAPEELEEAPPEEGEEDNEGGDNTVRNDGSEPPTEQRDRPVAASVDSFPDPQRLAEIDTQAYDSLEDLIEDTTERALERIGAKVRSIGQGQDLGIDGVEALSNTDLAIRYEGKVPNQDVVIDQVVGSSLSRLDRILDRAFSRVRDVGLDLKMDEADSEQVRTLYASLVEYNIELAQDGKTGVWQSARRIIAIAGGGPDLAVVAAPTRTVGSGIALGPRSITALRDQYGVVPGEYVWLHQTRGSNEHPVHDGFAGRKFDGVAIHQDGIVWFPGDHDGCRCIAVPELVRVES